MDSIILLYSGIILLATIFGFFVGAAWGINKSGMRVYNDMKDLAQSYNRSYSDLVNIQNYKEPPRKLPEPGFNEVPEDIYDTALEGGTL